MRFTKKTNGLALVVASLLSQLIFFSPTNAAGNNVCCVYHKPNVPSTKCSVFNTNGNIIQIPVAVDGANSVSEFDCSMVKSDGTIGKEPFIKNGVDGYVVYPANLVGGHAGSISNSELQSGTANSLCLSVSGYTPEVLKAVGGVISKKDEQTCLIGSYVEQGDSSFKQAYAAAVTAGSKELEAEKAKVKEAYLTLQQISQQTCCVPKKINPASNCFPPSIKPEITDIYSKFVSGLAGVDSQVTQLMTFKSVTPDTAGDPNQKMQNWNVAQYFTCDAAGSWESSYVMSGWSCNAIQKQEVSGWNYDVANCTQKSYYCLCRENDSDCDPTAYDQLEPTNYNDPVKQNDNTEHKACSTAMGAKNNGIDGSVGVWKCVYTTPKQKVTSNNFCAHLIKKGTAASEDKNSETISVSQLAKTELNRIGTTDIRVFLGEAVKILMGVMGSIALAMFVYAGFLWMVSGTMDSVEKARSILVWSSMGMVIIFASYALVQLIFATF